MIKFFKRLFANTLMVEVLQGDIDEVQPWNATACPLALALNRTLGGKWTVGVRSVFDEGFVRVRKYKLPEEAAQFREDFDMGREVHPFNFVLEK